MGASIVVDAFWGDSGKGKVAAWLTTNRRATYCVRAGTGTNAGHSILFGDGRSLRCRQLPCGLVHPTTQVRVGSGVAVDPEVFLAELSELEPTYGVRQRARIDYRCPIILPEHREREAVDPNLTQRIGSVGSGTGAARADFILRRARQARDLPELEGLTADVAREVNEACSRGETVVVEGSQGTHLSLALTPDYPCCTSDNCTATASADDVGLSWRWITEVVLVVKALPSRVGQGPLPLELEQATVEARGIGERGVVTGRPRRKAAGISWPHLEEAVILNGPTSLALTFCDHLDPAVRGARSEADLTLPVRSLIDELEERLNLPVALCDCGPLYEDLIELN